VEFKCSSCGEAVSRDARFCKSCGAAIDWSAVAPRTATPIPTEPVLAPGPAPGSGADSSFLCPGCRTYYGPAGALCPHCGSKLPAPGNTDTAAAVAAVSAAVLVIGLLISIFDSDVGNPIAGLGVLGLIAAAVIGVGSSGRVGPEQKSSCCGCSCVVLLLVLPTTGLLLWDHAGPAAALLAIPVWIPLSWLAEGVRLMSLRLLGSYEIATARS
jgi:hypothetical protein